MGNVLDTIKERHSARAPFDPGKLPSKKDMERILEAASWAPTAHNMQNFEILVVDDGKTLDKIGKIKSPISEEFIRENYLQLSFSEDELLKKGTGILGTFFPKSWTTPPFDMDKIARETGSFSLKDGIDGSPMILIVMYDPGRRAPASVGDFLGILSLGCVMENIWLAASKLGISARILSEFGEEPMEKEIKKALDIPGHMKIAYAIRLGYAAAEPHKIRRARREIEKFTHHNKYGKRLSK